MGIKDNFPCENTHDSAMFSECWDSMNVPLLGLYLKTIRIVSSPTHYLPQPFRVLEISPWGIFPFESWSLLMMRNLVIIQLILGGIQEGKESPVNSSSFLGIKNEFTVCWGKGSDWTPLHSLGCQNSVVDYSIDSELFKDCFSPKGISQTGLNWFQITTKRDLSLT